MKTNNSFISFFISSTLGDEKGSIFHSYVWGDQGIGHLLKPLKHEIYGQDLLIILFQFYVNPEKYLLDNLIEIESYRKKEKSIGIPVIITESNFFKKSEMQRLTFLRNTIIDKLYLLKKVIESHQLDVNIQLLRVDIEKILNREFNL